MKIRVKDIIITVLILLAGTLLFVAMFMGAVIQQSLRNCPPTQAEMAEEPSLEVYLNG